MQRAFRSRPPAPRPFPPPVPNQPRAGQIIPRRKLLRIGRSMCLVVVESDFSRTGFSAVCSESFPRPPCARGRERVVPQLPVRRLHRTWKLLAFEGHHLSLLWISLRSQVLIWRRSKPTTLGTRPILGRKIRPLAERWRKTSEA